MSKVDLKRDSEKRQKNKFSRKHKRDAKLQELEKQLQFAESRCGTLKQQLDYIKLLYGCRKCTSSEIKLQLPFEDGHGGGDNINYLNYDESSKWNRPNTSVGNKEDGDAPEFLNGKISHSNTTCTNSTNKQMQISTKEEELKMKGTFKQKSHLKFQKVKKKNSKKIKKKRKTDDASSSKFSNVSSQTHSQIWQDPVVEIYKNSALNAESESGLELVCNKKRIIAKEILLDMKNLSPFKNHETTEEKASGEPKPTRTNSHNSKKWGAFKEEAIQTEICLEGLLPIQARENEGKDFSNKENVGKTESLFESSKSYCQPTISSKRKQVDRDLYSNISGINVRSIPFIAAKSTTPSHNIGVNIQQVLSIIKKRHVGNENSIISLDSNSNENRLMALLGPKKLAYNEMEPISEPSTAVTCSSESKKKSEGVRTNLSHWRSSSDFNKDKQAMMKEKGLSENQSLDWSLKVDRLKKVLVFLHEDFTSLSQKYKRLQKKLTKRNISKTDAKGELADIEKDLEKKEEEITVVIGLYKEVLSLREDLKKLQEKYNLITCGKALMLDGLKQSNSAHTQMTTLLRKIQNFQDRLKG